MKTHTVITVAMSPEDLSALIASAVRACLQETPFPPGRKRKMLSPRDIEEEFGIPGRMLTSWRQLGIGPPYSNFGRKVFYSRALFEKFMAAGQVRTTGFVDQ